MAAKQFADLIKKRNSSVGQLNRLSDWITGHFATVKRVSELETRVDTLHESFANYTNVQDQIEDLISSNPTLTDTEDRAAIEGKFYDTLADYKDCIQNITVTPTSSSAGNGPGPFSGEKSNVRLPEIKIPNFDGSKPSDFAPFFDIFEALIGSNPKLRKAEKLYYLRTLLKDSALQIIENLKVIDSNYDVAISTLKKRFENRSIIVNEHLANLFSCPNIVKANAANLRELTNTLTKELECLNNLGISEKVLTEALIVFMFERKLDPLSRKIFEEERINNDIPTLKDFITFAERRSIILENLSSFDALQDRKPAYQDKKILLSLILESICT